MRNAFVALAGLAGISLLRGAEPSASTLVDGEGVWRWTASGREIALFGVNYTAPFAYSYRAHQRLGIPIEKAIDADVYHFARLGLDAYRVHVWDRQISDAAGNLLVNEHVRAFDYLLARLKERGIKIVLTPLQFGDAGYPEPGEALPGFSNKYGKQGCLEDRESWPLQERYLAQFISHVNPATGRAYKDDPDIIGIEICNEPGHFEYAPTVEYINRMVQALRGAGCAQPIFYNMSHGLPVFAAYLDAAVQGGTFQWYPSNLVAGHEQRGNFLPYVDDYPIPFGGDPRFRHKAKIVYEFDSADIGRSYLYPAMARAFRKAGMQFATQFAYDPLYLAPYNTEYQTHYLNLAYAPQKALSLMVAAEAFRRTPRFQDDGAFPANTTFAGARVSYEQDLAELVTAERFYYSNHTSTRPPAPPSLEHVAGYGRSPVVDYPGQGAYFLDRLEPGVWRLEVMPDAIWVRDPFERASLKKRVACIAWNEWPMRIDLPDLGDGYRAAGLNDGNDFSGAADGQTLHLRPGAYLLTRAGASTKWQREDRWGNIALREFVAPETTLDRTYVLHQPVVEATAGRSMRVQATVASPTPIRQVVLVAYLPKPPESGRGRPAPPRRVQPGGGNLPGPGVLDRRGAQLFVMKPDSGFEYSVEIAGDLVRAGTLRYHIAVEGPDGYETFPSSTRAFPTDWDFYGQPWEVRIVPPGSPILLFDAAADARTVTADGRDERYELVPSDRPGTTAMEVVARDLVRDEHDFSFRSFFRDRVSGRTADLGAVTTLVIYGRSATDKSCPLQVALVTADGIAYGGTVTLEPNFGAASVAVGALRQVRMPNIPHGYPVFIHFWSQAGGAIPLDLKRVESVLVSIGPGVPASEYGNAHGVQIERIWLE
ncbi:MAG TPA: hypothetical protein VLT83_13400 [Opitutaceae bacterium]|nr:hypothetical protein [Opitutaceae bacterium]